MTLDKLESLAIVSTAYSMHAAFISGLGFSSDVGLRENAIQAAAALVESRSQPMRMAASARFVLCVF